MKYFKGKFDWNYWFTYMHTLIIFEHISCKLRRLLSMFSLPVNAIWKLIRTIYQRMFSTKCHIRPFFVYNEIALLWSQKKVKGNTWFSLWLLKVSLLWSQGKVKGNTRFSLWSLNGYVHRRGPIKDFKKDFKDVFFLHKTKFVNSWHVFTNVCIA